MLEDWCEDDLLRKISFLFLMKFQLKICQYCLCFLLKILITICAKNRKFCTHISLFKKDCAYEFYILDRKVFQKQINSEVLGKVRKKKGGLLYI